MAFPEGFLFGTANADHQVESHDPEREDVWDVWERCQGLIPRGQATDFWNRYEEDIAAAAGIGCRLFRFSTAWARVEISDGVFDEAALAHYRRVAECIKKHDMKVMLTLHHFVWPVWLERDHGGMIGDQLPDLFARYADRVAAELGDLVDYWITFNEPNQLTFGYIRPWWHNRYYMPPGLPRGSHVDEEAQAVGKLVPNLFLANARARAVIKRRNPQAKVGVNPLVTGFPNWLQMLMDWGACHRGLSESVFKFTTGSALVSEKGDVDLVIAGVTADDRIRFPLSDPYLRTGKAMLVKSSFNGSEIESTAGMRVAVIGIGNQPQSWERDLPKTARKHIFANYKEARAALHAGTVDAIYGDAFFLMSSNGEIETGYRLLASGLTDEAYVAVAAHGHVGLLDRVNVAVEKFQNEAMHDCGGPWITPAGSSVRMARRPLSIQEVLTHQTGLTNSWEQTREYRRMKRRGKIRIAMRTDGPGMTLGSSPEGLEMKLARLIALETLGDSNALEVVFVQPSARLSLLESRSRWLNWVWRFWGTTSLIANANWWYLGTSGRLPEELCPAEAVGAQDFVGLDYYWGLPTHRLHQFRLLEDAAHGRFLRAPVWARGLFHAMQRFHRWFPGQEVFVVENGSVPMANGISRADYLHTHLAEVERAIGNGVPVKGYNYWSITSNREWGHPFDPNTDFGLYFVDLDKDPELRRVATEEVDAYKKIIAQEMFHKADHAV